MPDPGHCSDQETESNPQLRTVNGVLTPFTPASRAVDGHAAGPRFDQHITPAINQLLDDQPGQVGKEDLQAGFACRVPGMLHNELRGCSVDDQVLGRTRSSRSGRTYAQTVT
ncbi:hypothetical protein ACTMTI_52210 [Nonomuraea sp. H19]|uniref:hypothetical protein n=1 Tax=Nonomuraea sp. H19 TaxID=3452206 RepID=UPI003F8BE5B0